MVSLCCAVLQTLRGHEHVVESVSFGKKPVMTLVDEALGEAGAAAAAAGGEQEQTQTQQAEAQPFSYLVSGSRDKTVRLWEALRGECLGVFSFHSNWVRAVRFHFSGKFIISTSDDRSVKIVDIKEARCVRSIDDAHAHFVTCLAVPPPGAPQRVVLTGSVDKTVHVWGCY